MPICTHCGERNPDNVSVCIKCGIGMGHQLRANKDLKRAQGAQAIGIVKWIVIAIVLVITVPIGYHAAGAAYYRKHLKSMQERANSNCNGPVTPEMQEAERAKVERCLASDMDLVQAQRDLDNFTKGDKK